MGSIDSSPGGNATLDSAQIFFHLPKGSSQFTRRPCGIWVPFLDNMGTYSLWRIGSYKELV